MLKLAAFLLMISSTTLLAQLEPVDPKASFGSCRMTDNSCVDYIGKQWGENLAATRAQCEESEGEYQNSTCPTRNRVGRCQIAGKTEMEFQISSYKPTSQTTAKEACDSFDGVFSKN